MGEYTVFESVSDFWYGLLSLPWGARKMRSKHVLFFLFFSLMWSLFKSVSICIYCTGISLGTGKMRPLHCNCLLSVLVCSSVVHHQSLARYLTELNLFEVFFCNALLRSDQHIAGLFTCTTEQANLHLVLTRAFHEPMSAFKLHSLHFTVNSKPILHTCMNKQELFDRDSADFSMSITATDIGGILVLF